jgi:hypothetical protein
MYQVAGKVDEGRQLIDRAVSFIGMFEMEDINNSSSLADLNPCMEATVTQGFENASTDVRMGQNENPNTDNNRKTPKNSAVDPAVNEWFKAVSCGDTEMVRSLSGNKLLIDTRNEVLLSFDIFCTKLSDNRSFCFISKCAIESAAICRECNFMS